VQVLFRPEDIELCVDRAGLDSTALGRGRVEERSFSGPFERLRVRLDAIPGVRQITPTPPFGGQSLTFEVTRPQPEALAHPLQRADEVWLGARRAHVLAPARVEITVAGPAPTGPAPPASPARDFAVALATQVHGVVRYTAEIGRNGRNGDGGAPAGQAEPESFGLTAVDLGTDGAVQGGFAAAGGRSHLLIVPRASPLPKRFLVCVAVGEPGKVDVRLAERLAWRLGAEATVLTVLGERTGQVPEHVTRFLEASARVLSARGVPTQTRVRHGAPATEILAELAEGGHDLLVVGAPLHSTRSALQGGVIGRILREPIGCPLLIVRSH
jgi:sulfate/thiosulfate transport system ATP-binding protein